MNRFKVKVGNMVKFGTFTNNKINQRNIIIYGLWGI